MGSEPRDRYALKRRLAQSATSVVATADDKLLRRTVVIKAFVAPQLATTEARRSLARAVEQNKQIHHPNLCPIEELNDVRGRPSVVMPFIEGASLAELMIRDPPPERATVFAWLRDVATAMAAAHDQGAAHGGLDARSIVIAHGGGPVVVGLCVTAAVRALTTGAVASANDDVTALAALTESVLGGRAGPPLVGLRALLLRTHPSPHPRTAPTMRELAQGLAAAIGELDTDKHATMPLDVTQPLAFVIDDPTLPSVNRLADAGPDVRPPAFGGGDTDKQPLVDASHSWVVGGVVVDLPATPKAMEESAPSAAAPVEAARRTASPAMRRAAVLALVVGGAMVATALSRRDAVPPTTDASGDAGASVVVTEPDAGAPTVVAADAGTLPVDALAAAHEVMRARGLVVGDDIEADRFLDRIAHPADAEDAAEALAALRARVDAVPIEKSLVSRKLGRLRVEARQLSRGPERKELEGTLAQAERLLDKEELHAANAMLNDAATVLSQPR